MTDFVAFPNGQDLPPEEIERHFVMTEIRPPANPDFAFRMLVPRGWVPDTIDGMDRQVNAIQMTPLAAWHVEKEGAPIVFHVQAVGVMRAMSAAHFNLDQGLRQGMPLEAMREVSPFVAETLFLKEIEGQPFGLRMATALIGDRAFVATGIAHAADLTAFNPAFGVMMASLEVIERPAAPWVENRTRRTLLGKVEFDAPNSFRSMPVPGLTDTHHVIDLAQRQPDGEYTGVIRVDYDLEAVERTLDEELAYVAAHVANRGAELSNETRELVIEPGEGPLQARKSLMVKATAGDVPQEVWITLLNAHGAALRIWMIGPAREAHFQEWAINQRGYRILLETLAAR